MNEKETIDLIEKQLRKLGDAGIDVSGDLKFFSVGEWELALEGIYVALKRHPGILNAEEVQKLVDDFGLDTSEFDQ